MQERLLSNLEKRRLVGGSYSVQLAWTRIHKSHRQMTRPLQLHRKIKRHRAKSSRNVKIIRRQACKHVSSTKGAASLVGSMEAASSCTILQSPTSARTSTYLQVRCGCRYAPDYSSGDSAVQRARIKIFRLVEISHSASKFVRSTFC